MTLRRQARFEKLRESSKERIESAALELFAQNGYGHTSISQIAKAAGISKGLMYNYYESKEALLQAIVRKGFEMSDNLVQKGMEQIPDDPVELLKFFVEASFAQFETHFKYYKLYTAMALQEEVMKEVKADVDEKKNEHLKMGKALFARLGHPQPEEQAVYFGSIFDGVFFHYLLDPKGYPLEKMKERIVADFCKKYE